MKPFHHDFDHFYQEIHQYFSQLHENFEVMKQENDVKIKLTSSEALIAFFNDFFKRYSNLN